MKNFEKDRTLLYFVIFFTTVLWLSVVIFLSLLMFGVGHNIKYATDCVKDYVRIAMPALITIPSSIFTYFLGKKVAKMEQKEVLKE